MAARLVAALGVISALGLAQPGGGRSQPVPAYRIGFAQQIGLPDLRLAGPAAARRVVFHCESGRRPREGSALHLILEHSPDIDGERSFLSVTLNYGILRSIRLDEETRRLTEVVVAIPPGQLRARNELVFSVDQAALPGGAAERLHTSISARSYIEIAYEETRTAPNLSLLPSPLVDPYSYRPKAYDVLVPERAGKETLEATALLAANFAARVAPEPVEANPVASIRTARRPLLVVGTVEEQPVLRALAGVPRDLAEGAAGFSTTPEGVPVLFVAGRTPQWVLIAARNMVERPSQLSGTLARVTSEPAFTALEPWRWKGHVPPRTRFTLADLGLDEVRIGPDTDFRATVRLDSSPDARFLDYGPQMILEFRFEPAALDHELTVELNGTELERARVREVSRAGAGSVNLRIPGRLLKTRNLLRVELRGPAGRPGAGPLAALLPQSSFYLPRDYNAELPDLSLLAFHLYPFSLRADLSDVTILMPAKAGAAMLGPLLELASSLGRLAPADRLRFRVRRIGELSADEAAASHIAYLHTPSLEAPPERVFPRWPKGPRAQLPAVQEAASPWNPAKWVLSIGAGSADELRGTIRRVFSAETLGQLAGDLAYLGPGRPSCVTVALKQRIEESSRLVHLEAWLRANWLALPLILTAASGLLYVGLRLMLERYKSGLR